MSFAHGLRPEFRFPNINHNILVGIPLHDRLGNPHHNNSPIERRTWAYRPIERSLSFNDIQTEVSYCRLDYLNDDRQHAVYDINHNV